MLKYWQSLEHERKMRHEKELQGFEIFSPFPIIPVTPVPCGRFMRAASRYLFYALQMRFRTNKFDLAHILDHSEAHLIPHLPKDVISVVTVHDIAPLWGFSDLTAAQIERFQKVVNQIRKADLILTVSEFSANDISTRLGIDRSSMRVLLEGVDYDSFQREISPESNSLRPLAGQRFLLSIGLNHPRKNLEALPEIFGHLPESLSDTILVRVGEKLSDAQVSAFSRAAGKDRLIELGFVSDDELIWLYQQASALIFPSTLEGFGFPLLEAMAAGCPVVSSDAASLPEVGGDAVLYFSPHDTQKAAAQIEMILNNASLREELENKGRERARKLSWSNHFLKLLEIYQELAERKAAG